MKTFIKVLFVLSVLFLGSCALANTNIHLRIETNTGSIYNQDMVATPCDSEGDGVMKATPYCALVQSGVPSDWSGLWMNSVNNIPNNDGGNGAYWMWLANLNIDPSPGSPYSLSGKQYTLSNNDNILFYYNTNPLDISIDKLNPKVGESIKITGKELGLDPSWNPVWNNAVGGKAVVNSTTYDLDANGTYTYLITSTDQLSIKIQKNNFIDSRGITINPAENICTICGSASTGTPIVTETPKTEQKIKQSFDIKKALDFLALKQEENGSFGEDMYTDWTTIALAGGNYQNQILKLVKYFGESKITGTLLTDYERRAMTLMTLGLNPYNTNGENYIEKIISKWDGKQFGDVNEDNDDIFALIVLSNAGYTENEQMVKDDINFILKRQREDGSWDESVDMTGAGIQALSLFSPIPGVGESLAKAKEFLKQKQKDDGGWENASSTAWAIGGILALPEKIEDWKKGENTPLDYLTTLQDTDGGIKDENLKNKIWKTAYVASALSGKTWNQIMQKFEKPEEQLAINTPKEEKEQSLKISPKKIPKKTIQNTATVINTVPETPTVKTETQSRGWFMWLLGNIFGF